MMRFHLPDGVRRMLSLRLFPAILPAILPALIPALIPALVAAIAIGAAATPTPAAAQSGGTIEGLVYADLDGDGQAGPEEPGLPGVIVRLTDESNTSRTVLTNLTGSYNFNDLETGEYDIKVETGRDFNPTTLASYDGIAVGDDSLTGLDFGLEAESAAAEAIVEQAIEDAEANADATAESVAADEADEEESMDEESADVEGDVDEDTDEDAGAEEDAAVAETEVDEGSDDAEASDEAMDADADSADESASADEDEDSAVENMDGSAGDMDDAVSDYGGGMDDSGEDADGGSVYEPATQPVDEMPVAGFEDMGIPGMLAALAIGLAALAAAGVWRERRIDVA